MKVENQGVKILYRFALIAFTLIISLKSWAQQGEKVLIQGVVVGADSLAPLPFVHIRGKLANAGTATDSQGKFNVNVPKQDTMLFTSVGYLPFLLVPSDSTEENLQNLMIIMTSSVSELEEVTVRAYDNIEQYIRREPEPFSLNRKKGEPLFERTEPREVPQVGTAGGMNGARLEGGLTALANLFSSSYQQKKKLKEIIAIKEAEDQQQALQIAMTDKYQEMLAFATNLSAAEIQRFTLTFMPEARAMAYMDDYTIMLGIHQNLKSFKRGEEREKEIQNLLKSKVFEGERNATGQ